MADNGWDVVSTAPAPSLVPAIKTDTGIVVGKPGQKHDDLGAEGDRGFVDANGAFLTRKEAGAQAQASGLDVPDSLHTSSLNKANDDWSVVSTAPAPPSKFAQSMNVQTKAPWYEHVGTGLRDMAEGAAQLAGRVLPIPAYKDGQLLSRAEFEKQYRAKRDEAVKAELGHENGTDWWRVAGQTAATIPMSVMGMSPIASGAAFGAMQPASEDNFWKEKAEQVGWSALGAKAGEAAGSLAAKVLAPTGNALKDALIKAGVTLTPGQMAGPLAKRAEEAAKSIPIVGSMIRSGEARALDSFNAATVDKALEPIGVKTGETTGRTAIAAGRRMLSDAYDDVLKQIPSFRADQGFLDDITNLRTMATEFPPAQTAQFENILENRVIKRLAPNGAMDGQTMKGVESELTNLAKGYKGSADAAQRQLGHAIDEVNDAMRGALTRQYPSLAPALSKINSAYAMFKRVEDAASRSAIGESRFTPGQLLQAVKVGKANKAAFARGDALLQDWAEGAQKVMGNKLPDSGTPERGLWTLGDLGGAGVLAGLHNPYAIAGVAGASSLYTEPGMNFLRKMAVSFPNTRNMLAKGAQQAGQLAAPGAAATANALIGVGQ